MCPTEEPREVQGRECISQPPLLLKQFVWVSSFLQANCLMKIKIKFQRHYQIGKLMIKATLMMCVYGVESHCKRACRCVRVWRAIEREMLLPHPSPPPYPLPHLLFPLIFPLLFLLLSFLLLLSLLASSPYLSFFPSFVFLLLLPVPSSNRKF